MSQEKGMTITEFKYWLEGVEEMQPDDWTPDNRQWKRIREKLDTIIETPQQLAPVYQQPVYIIPEQLEQTPYQGPTQMAQPGLSRNLIPSSPNNNILFGNADNPAIPVRTPNVDSSNGNYEPAFV